MQTENAPSLLCQGRGNFVRSCLMSLVFRPRPTHWIPACAGMTYRQNRRYR